MNYFRYDTDYKILLYCLHRFYSVVGVISKEGLTGYDNDKDIKVCFLVTCVIWNQTRHCEMWSVLVHLSDHDKLGVSPTDKHDKPRNKMQLAHC